MALPAAGGGMALPAAGGGMTLPAAGGGMALPVTRSGLAICLPSHRASGVPVWSRAQATLWAPC
jgi:hypothetical protein